MRFSLPLLAACAGVSQALATRNLDFDPNAYKKSFAHCPAVDRADLTPVDITLKLAYLDINPTAEKTIIMLHGWPSLWTTYRNQIKSFGSDYRLILMENRGFGDSEHPHDLFESNNMPDFVSDILCIMDHAGVDAGICMGNDFGAQVCWEAGRMRPDRFIGVFNAVVPYVPSAGPFVPNEKMVEISPGFGYQLYLTNNARGAAAELDADPRAAIRSVAQLSSAKWPKNFLQLETSFLGPWKQELKGGEIPFSGIMSQQVEDYMVASYQKQGFYNTFNGYQRRNRYDTWRFDRAQGNYTLHQPTFSLWPTKDPVGDYTVVAKIVHSADFLTNHYNATIDTAHWPHEELPDQFDAHFRQWVGNVTFPTKSK
ncbi:Epoxide hydrolase A-like protein [Cladobotryum mycophilum]|uniref:Epoxide hydrolase A-like protein n=1 Tax=Cladobotryum mycophilum TaxID=491253 RepID=A0ABR0SWG6_9HYPO